MVTYTEGLEAVLDKLLAFANNITVFGPRGGLQDYPQGYKAGMVHTIQAVCEYLGHIAWVTDHDGNWRESCARCGKR